jgi:hypothetical protein
MNTILVWVLVTVGGHYGNQVVYSPQMADLESCKRVQESLVSRSRRLRGACVQILVPISK